MSFRKYKILTPQWPTFLGISDKHPTGLRWVRVNGGLKYVSVSSYDGSTWGVSHNDKIWYRQGTPPITNAPSGC